MNRSTAERAARIREATLRARVSWEEYTLAQQRRIFDMFDAAGDRVSESILAFTEAGKLPPARLIALRKEIAAEMARLRAKLNTGIISGMKGSVNMGLESGMLSMSAGLNGLRGYDVEIGNAFIGKDGIVRKFDQREELYSNSLWAKINTQAMDALTRYSPLDVTLSDRIWKVSMEAEESIRSILGTSVAMGESPYNMSKQIREFLRGPKDNEAEWAKKYGVTMGQKGSRSYVPGRGMYRNPAANAMRLARTEMARAHTEGTMRYAMEKSWIVGYISHTTSGNPAPYDESIDGRFFLKGDEPSPPYHPNCLPDDTVVNAVGDTVGTSKRWYEGEMISIETSTGQKLTCTPNHPIFVNGGFIGANRVNVGDSVVCVRPLKYSIWNIVYNINKPALIQKIVSAFNKRRGFMNRPVEISAKDFHGDGIGSKVAIICTNSLLRDSFYTRFKKMFLQGYFRKRSVWKPFLICQRTLAFCSPRILHSSPCKESVFCNTHIFTSTIFAGAKKVGRFLSTNFNSVFYKPFFDGNAGYIEFLRKLFYGKSRIIKGNNSIIGQINSIAASKIGYFDKITHIKSFPFSGYVYNIETTQSYYFANHIATHNCMCYLELVYDESKPEKDKWADDEQRQGPEHWNKINQQE